MIALEDGRIRCRVKITGSYRGTKFEYVDPADYAGSQFYHDDDPSSFWWSEGNFSCDCNRKSFLPPELRAAFIDEHGDGCGDEIMIDEVIPIDYPDGKPLLLNETKNGKK